MVAILAVISWLFPFTLALVVAALLAVNALAAKVGQALPDGELRRSFVASPFVRALADSVHAYGQGGRGELA